MIDHLRIDFKKKDNFGDKEPNRGKSFLTRARLFWSLEYNINLKITINIYALLGKFLSIEYKFDFRRNFWDF